MANSKALNELTEIGLKETINDFPRDISLKYDGKDTLTMLLCAKAAGFHDKPDNMQTDAAAFESWCFVIKAKTDNKNLKIQLDIKNIPDKYKYDGLKPKNGHLGRFLYRILKFSEQYDWFKLSAELDAAKVKFKNFLKNNKFENNVPSGPSETDENKLWNKGLEKYVEWLLVDKKKNILIAAPNAIIDRQLPVGLFLNKKERGSKVFTGGASAIDLWALDNKNKTINIYELKTKNPMVGIFTEIFFYSNYVCDVFLKKSLYNTKNVKCLDSKHRQYDKLKDTKFSKIKGIMISNRDTGVAPIKNNDSWHNAIIGNEKQIIDLMNDNKTNKEIQYNFQNFQIEFKGVIISK